MSNPTSFINNYVVAIQQIISDLETLRTMNDQLTQDPTLITRYFATVATPGRNTSGPRDDIVAQDVTNAESAITQLLFAFDSGSPTQKSFLFKLLP